MLYAIPGGGRLAATLVALTLSAAANAADPCAEIAQATVAEMRAGAGDWWTDDVEGLVRAAAGSACIKALSGRYGQSEMLLSDSPVVARADDEQAPEEADASEDGSVFNLGGLKIRPMTSSPTKKSYERARRDDN